MFQASCWVPGVITVKETGQVPPSQIPSLLHYRSYGALSMGTCLRLGRSGVVTEDFVGIGG